MRRIILHLLTMATLSCVSPNEPRTQLDLPVEGKAISFDELSVNHVRTPKLKVAKLATNSSEIARCDTSLHQATNTAKQLNSHLTIPVTAERSFYSKLFAFKSRDCRDPAKRRQILTTIAATQEIHNGKVGVLLPLTGRASMIGHAILAGMKHAAENMHMNFAQNVIVRDTASTVAGLEKGLADITYREPVGMILGGVTAAEQSILKSWADRLSIPVGILAPNAVRTQTLSPYVFHIFPNEQLLAKTLADAAMSRGYQKVAILRPTKNVPVDLSDMFADAAQADRIKVVVDASYNPNDFATMEAAAQKIFRTDTAERGEEYSKLMEQKKIEAEAQGVAFNPRSVTLPPQVTFDALLIADNFRSVRHFVKIFKYLGVKRLPLIGTHEWRSMGLVDPPEPFLAGALFADFVGSYKTLPTGIQAPTVQSEYFLDPAYARGLDYNLVGYHALDLANRTVSDKKLLKSQLPKVLLNMTARNSPLFNSDGPVFDASKQTRWPTYLFGVSSNDIAPLGAR